MKGIKKFADEIFQAPTEDQLVHRWMESEGLKEPQNKNDVINLVKDMIEPSSNYKKIELKNPNILEITISKNWKSGDEYWNREWESNFNKTLLRQKYWERDSFGEKGLRAVEYWTKKFNLEIKINEKHP